MGAREQAEWVEAKGVLCLELQRRHARPPRFPAGLPPSLALGSGEGRVAKLGWGRDEGAEWKVVGCGRSWGHVILYAP